MAMAEINSAKCLSNSVTLKGVQHATKNKHSSQSGDDLRKKANSSNE